MQSVTNKFLKRLTHMLNKLKSYFSILFIFLSQIILAQDDIIEGSYHGLFNFGDFHTDIGLDIQKTNDTFEIQFNSLEQNALGIPAREIKIAGDSLKFVLQSDYFKYSFKGKLINNSSLALNLIVDQKAFDFKLLKKNREDSPKIKSKDVRFRSENLLLYGTIYFPEKPNGKAIYLVTSSGNNDRSASRAEAMMFAQNGFITFHTDKRGTGISDGIWQIADIPTLCNDDIRAIQYLSQIEKLSLSQIGIKGSSQGATKIPYIMSKLPQIGFGIAVSCPGSSLLESDLNYWENRNKTIIDSTYLEAAIRMQKSVFLYISGDISKSQLQEHIERHKNEPWFEHIWIPVLEEVETDPKLNYSPLPFFGMVKQPLLVLQGNMDEVIPAASLETIKKSVQPEKYAKNKYIMLKGADHSMMFVGESDFPYWSTLHPDYMKTMLKWIDRL